MENNIIYEGPGLTHPKFETDGPFLTMNGPFAISSLFSKGTCKFFRNFALKNLAIIFFAALLVIFGLLYLIPGFQSMQPLFSAEQNKAIQTSPELEKTNIALRQKVEKEIKNNQKILLGKIPKNPYMIINTTQNRFLVYSGSQLLKTGFCSTGSLTVLKKSEQEKWAFQTPKGIRTVRSKTKDPVWKKPDWAFIEEGLPVPSSNDASRFDYATLGDYSLGLGNGYLIHGTLYQRLLGMPVTHGCVRLGDEDLEFVFKSLPLGAKVYIF